MDQFLTRYHPASNARLGPTPMQLAQHFCAVNAVQESVYAPTQTFVRAIAPPIEFSYPVQVQVMHMTPFGLVQETKFISINHF